jgi:hypothetical protein
VPETIPILFGNRSTARWRHRMGVRGTNMGALYS